MCCDCLLTCETGGVSLPGVSRLDQSEWIPMAEQAVCVIYTLAEHPDSICSDIIKHASESVFNYHQQGEPPEASQPTPEVSQPTPEGMQSPSVTSWSPAEKGDNRCGWSWQTISTLSIVLVAFAPFY